MSENTLEQQARDILERAGDDYAQQRTARRQPVDSGHADGEKTLRDAVVELRNEVQCRIQHGGLYVDLTFVCERLNEMLTMTTPMDAVQRRPEPTSAHQWSATFISVGKYPLTWFTEYDDDANPWCWATSPYHDNGTPFLWRLRPRLANGRIEWYASHDSELGDDPEWWLSIDEGLKAVQKAHDMLTDSCE